MTNPKKQEKETATGKFLSEIRIGFVSELLFIRQNQEGACSALSKLQNLRFKSSPSLPPSFTLSLHPIPNETAESLVDGCGCNMSGLSGCGVYRNRQSLSWGHGEPQYVCGPTHHPTPHRHRCVAQIFVSAMLRRVQNALVGATKCSLNVLL